MDYKLIEGYKFKDLERFTYEQLEGDGIPPKEQYIILYSPNETNFDNLGLGVLNDILIDPIVTRTINGDYNLKFSAIRDVRGKYKRIKPMCIVKALGQLFRIPLWDGVKDNEFTITVEAKHIFYDLKSAFIEDRRVQNQNVYEALSRIIEYDDTNRFRIGVCDVTKTINANFIDEHASDSIMKKVVPRSKGELLRDNFTIAIKNRLGKYKPNLFVCYGVNAGSIKKSVDYTQMCTRIYPKGKFGKTIEEGNDGRKFIDSLKVNKYPILFPRKIKFDDLESIEEIIVSANDYLDLYDKPQVRITIDYLDLYNNKEYEHLKEALKIELGDTVTAYDIDFSINEEIRCIQESIHATKGIKLKVILGEKIPDIADTLDENSEKIDKTDYKVDDVILNQLDANESLENINKNIESLNLDISGLGNRVMNIENKEPLFFTLDVDIVDMNQIVLLPDEFKGNNFIISSISVIKDDNEVKTNIIVVDSEKNIAEGTFYLNSNVINIKVRIFITSIKKN